MARYFIRCSDCLAVGAVDVEGSPRPYTPAVMPGVCPCGGSTEVMGRVQGPRLARDVTESVCDDRCTNAKGPHCSCTCGGKNHGSKAVVTVSYDAGPKPRYELKPDRGRALEYRVARAEAELRLRALNSGDVVARKLRGQYLSADEFCLYRRIGRGHEAIRRAMKLRTHGGRLKALAKVEADVTPADVESGYAA